LHTNNSKPEQITENLRNNTEHIAPSEYGAVQTKKVKNENLVATFGLDASQNGPGKIGVIYCFEVKETALVSINCS
jgi:hypothetical protein